MPHLPLIGRTPLCAALLLAPHFVAIAQADTQQHLPVVKAKAKHEDAERRRDAVQPLRAIGRDEIDKTNDLTLGEFLRRQAGVSYSGPPGNLKDIRLRGMDKGYTQILVDGEPWLSSTKERQVQVDQLPMSMVERVEIIRSPLPDQAADGVAGAINIVLRRAEERELTLRVSAGAQDSQAGSQPQGAVQFTWAEGGQGDWSWVLPVNLTRRHELKTKTKQTEAFNAGSGARSALTGGSEVEDNEVTEWSLGPRLSWKPSERDLLVFNAFANLNGGAKHKTTVNDRAPDLRQPEQRIVVNSTVEDEAKDRDTLLAALRWQHQHSADLQHALGLSAQRGSEDRHKPKLDYNAQGQLTKTEIEDTSVRARSLRAFGDLRWQPAAAHGLAAGVSLAEETRQDRRLKNGALQAGLGDRFDIAEDKATFWLRHDWKPTAAHSLSWGLRHEERRTASDDGSGKQRQSRAGASQPSAAWRWQATEPLALRLAAARTQRAPKFENLSNAVASGSGTATTPFVSGNPALLPEDAKGIDLGADLELWGRDAWVGINLSRRWIASAVERRTQLEADGFHYSRPFNVPGTSRTQAIELDARLDLRKLGLRHWQLNANYSRFGSRKAGSTDPLGNQPRHVANLGLDWRWPKQKLLLGARYNHQGRIEKSGGEHESAQRLLDAHAQWELGKRWSLRLAAANLLDTRKTKHKPKLNAAGAITELALEEERGGRSFLITLETRL